ncbi:hypothetical protein CYY_000984 [Polysphondylium violaceum]|uniref:CCDC43 PWI-like domain-containing protein n=1 Tax=Polysphondylium violaceum TaxID=133409 RepID=A0A8J4Q2T8_9MYCE|nr:hypothetical protein CYY_000984 [Polysphondylium violaceum]
MNEKKLRDFISESLRSLEADDSDAVVDYIYGIVSDSDSNNDEKIESIGEFISSITEKGSDSFCTQLIEMNKEFEKEKENQETLKKTTEKLESELKIKQVAESELCDQQETYENSYYKMTREQQKQRDMLLAKYGYDEEDVDEHGDILISDHIDKKEKEQSKIQYHLGGENINAKKVADEEKAKREKSKFEHAKKVERDKELLAKQKKDEEKKKTVKKEKRRL